MTPSEWRVFLHGTRTFGGRPKSRQVLLRANSWSPVEMKPKTRMFQPVTSHHAAISQTQGDKSLHGPQRVNHHQPPEGGTSQDLQLDTRVTVANWILYNLSHFSSSSSSACNPQREKLPSAPRTGVLTELVRNRFRRQKCYSP